jgi:ABC-type bacteriocin/lantibiotic exporter with double-glycine peptidase domain
MGTNSINTEARRSRSAQILCAICVSVVICLYFASYYITGVRFVGGEGVVWQRYSSDCGAAALQMVFSHFDIASDYEDLARGLGVTSEGASMLRLKRAADAKGLLCRGWRLTARDLPDIPLPAILFLRRNHFVVLDSYSPGGDLIIRDPARGRLQLSMRKLESIWGGETLLFTKPGKDSAASMRWFGSSPISERSHS